MCKERIKKLLLNNPYIEFHTNPLSFIISFLPSVDINVLKEKLCEKRIKIRFLSSFCQNNKDDRMLLCYSSLNKEDIEEAIGLLNKLIKESLIEDNV